jgi:hypothetical protein
VQLGPSLAEQWPHASSPELLAALAAAVD